MPYRLHISEEEVREELRRLGYGEVPSEMVSSFRKDLLRLIKADIQQIKKERSQQSSSHTSGSSLPFGDDGRAVSNISSRVSRSQSQPSLSSHTASGVDTIASDSSSLQRRIDKLHHRAMEDRQDAESGYSDDTASSRSSMATSSRTCTSGFISGSSSVSSDPPLPARRRAPSLPPYPRRTDPVSLYHYYRAHWDAKPAPGEDPRSALRWKVRADLFYST